MIFLTLSDITCRHRNIHHQHRGVIYSDCLARGMNKTRWFVPLHDLEQILGTGSSSHVKNGIL